MNQNNQDSMERHDIFMAVAQDSPWKMVVWDYFPFGFRLTVRTFRGKLLFLLGMVIFSRRGMKKPKIPSISHHTSWDPADGSSLSGRGRENHRFGGVKKFGGRSKDDGFSNAAFGDFPYLIRIGLKRNNMWLFFFGTLLIQYLKAGSKQLILSIWVCPKIRGTPKWMVYNGKPFLKLMIWGENPLFPQTSIWNWCTAIFQFVHALTSLESLDQAHDVQLCVRRKAANSCHHFISWLQEFHKHQILYS